MEGRPRHRDSRLAHLYTMGADGTAVRDLTPEFTTVINHVPQWAPDGQRLAFVARDAEHRRTLYTIRADGTELRRIGLAASGPSWSPDGRRLAFAQPEGSAITLVTVGSNGEDARGIATIEGWQPTTIDPDPMFAWIDSVAWSPAGGQVLYTCGQRICVSATDGTPVGVSSRPVDGEVAAWSPDGTRIAVAAERRNLAREPSEPVLYHTAPDGRDVRILAVVGADQVLVAPGAQNSKVPAGDDICADGTLIREPRVYPELVGDCRELLGLRGTLFGPRGARSNWSWGAELSEWVGLTIEGFKPRVSAIDLGSRGLVATIPAALGDLTALRTLDLSRNSLAGEIPATLGNLEHLDVLYLGGNRLTGCVPPKLLEVRRNDLESLGLPVCEVGA